MSTLTLEVTPGQAEDRSVPAGAGARRASDCPGGGKSSNPEVVPVAKRRRHSDKYKLKVLAEIDANPGKTGIILRREGLYSSYLSKWREWRDKMSSGKKPTSENKQLHNELAKLRRKNARLELKLQKAEGLMELQKKASERLELMSKSESDDS